MIFSQIIFDWMSEGIVRSPKFGVVWPYHDACLALNSFLNAIMPSAALIALVSCFHHLGARTSQPPFVFSTKHLAFHSRPLHTYLLLELLPTNTDSLPQPLSRQPDNAKHLASGQTQHGKNPNGLYPLRYRHAPPGSSQNACDTLACASPFTVLDQAIHYHS